MKKELVQLFIIFVFYQGIFAQNFQLEGQVEASKLDVLDKKWMPHYLNTKVLNNGEKLRVLYSLNDSVNSWNTWSSNTEEPAVFIDNQTGLHLYSLSAVNNVNLCPTGYRVPQSRDLTSFSTAISRKLITEYNSKEICYETDPDKCASTAFFKLYSRQMEVISLTNRKINKNSDENDVGVYGTYFQFDINKKDIRERPTCNALDKGAYTVLCIENDSTRYNLDREYSYVDLLPDVSEKFIKSYINNNYKTWFKSPGENELEISFDKYGNNTGFLDSNLFPPHYDFNKYIQAKSILSIGKNISNQMKQDNTFENLLNNSDKFKIPVQLRNFNVKYEMNTLNSVFKISDERRSITNQNVNTKIPWANSEIKKVKITEINCKGPSYALWSMLPWRSGLTDVGPQTKNHYSHEKYKKGYVNAKKVSFFVFLPTVIGAPLAYKFLYTRDPYASNANLNYSVANSLNVAWQVSLSAWVFSTGLDMLHTYLVGAKNKRNLNKFKYQIENKEFTLANEFYAGEVIEFPEVEAEFPGGYEAMQKWLQQNLNYPEKSMQTNEQGKVYVKFVVEKDGKLSNIEVIKGISRELDNEAKRLVRSMPEWIPAKDKGMKVRSSKGLPIPFSLDQ
jgi:protein TonB